MKILGVLVHSHDTSVALIEDGKVLYAASEERFSRLKMDKRPPLKALENCLSYVRISPKDIDEVVFVGDPFFTALKEMTEEASLPMLKSKGKYAWWLIRKPILAFEQVIISLGFPGFLKRAIIPEYRIRRRLAEFKGKYSYVHHHMAHLASAYYTSGWRECLVACVEGAGLTESMSVYHVKNNVWKKITQSDIPNSAGKFYELVTMMLGFNRYRHPGKITGLSASGDPKKAYHLVKDLLKTDSLRLKLDYLRYLKLQSHVHVHKKIPPEFAAFKREDVAAAFQKRLEECVSEIIQKIARKTKMRRIALAGGVFANVKLNQRIHELKEIDEIHIHQAMGDDGLALGAALKVYSMHNFKPGRLDNVYFGPDFSDDDILKSIKKYHVSYTKEKNIEKKVAELLAQKKIVARFNGRMEYGPRALGNRSILLHGTDRSANEWLNIKLKKRSDFMPFAPVTLERFASKFFKNLKGAEYPARFMTITFDATPYAKRVSSAIVHVDGTARPQIIRECDNPSYYKILEEYYNLTGIPTLINTSFNMHEDPIVCSPDDAVKSFIAGKLDYLAIGNYLLKTDESFVQQ